MLIRSLKLSYPLKNEYPTKFFTKLIVKHFSLNWSIKCCMKKLRPNLPHMIQILCHSGAARQRLKGA